MVGFKVCVTSYTVALALFKELFVKGPYEFETSSSAPLILDCGAHLGFATLYFKWRVPHATVDAFERDPNACSLLRENVRANGLSDVRVHQLVIGSATGTANLYSANDYVGGVTNSPAEGELGTGATSLAPRLGCAVIRLRSEPSRIHEVRRRGGRVRRDRRPRLEQSTVADRASHHGVSPSHNRRGGPVRGGSECLGAAQQRLSLELPPEWQAPGLQKHVRAYAKSRR